MLMYFNEQEMCWRGIDLMSVREITIEYGRLKIALKDGRVNFAQRIINR